MSFSIVLTVAQTLTMVYANNVIARDDKSEIEKAREIELTPQMLRIAREKFDAMEMAIILKIPDTRLKGTLSEDRAVLLKAAKKIIPIFRARMLTDDDALASIAESWYRTRVKEHKEQLDVAAIMLSAATNTLVKISSIPESAKITLDGQSRKKPTNDKLWLAEGDYVIKLEKPGFIPVEDTLKVPKDSREPIEFKRTLNPEPAPKHKDKVKDSEANKSKESAPKKVN